MKKKSCLPITVKQTNKQKKHFGLLIFFISEFLLALSGDTTLKALHKLLVLVFSAAEKKKKSNPSLKYIGSTCLLSALIYELSCFSPQLAHPPSLVETPLPVPGAFPIS